MFDQIHNDSRILRSALDIPAGTLAVFADPAHPLEDGGLNLVSEYAFENLPNCPQAKGVKPPVLQLFYGGQVPLILLSSKPRLEMGYEVHELAYAIRLLGHTGIRSMLFFENAIPVGGELPGGEGLFLMEDLVNFMGVNPLVGPNYEAWGPRFPDMSTPFDPGLSALVSRVVESAGIPLKNAVYAGFRPECLQNLKLHLSHMHKAGATIAGSSLVQEVIIARHMGICVCALAHSSSHPGVFPSETLRIVLEGLAELD